MGKSETFDRELHRQYREEIERTILGDAIRNAALLFIVLQTVLFIPADWILHPEHFSVFVAARFIENGLLGLVYFKISRINAVYATAFTAFTGSTLFLYMVHMTGGVESGYYVGLMLLLVGIAVLAPLSGRQSALISGVILLSYASLPWTSHGGQDVDWADYIQHLFFLGSACVEAALACLLMDGLRFRDFCQRRELIEARDELAEMDKAKSRFSANVHHELRTPLTLILSPLEAIRSGDFGPVPEEIASTLETMHSNGRRLHKMINNLLDLSKLESEQFKIVRRPTRLDKLVVDLVSSATPMATRKQVELKHEGFDNPQELAIDPDAIEKVIVNLIGNALKFTGPGGSIRIVGEFDQDGATIRVFDTGIGIPPDKLDSVFDRFAQVDSSATRSYEGTGIGLSLAQEMVQLHDGRIWAESAGVGHGTTMSVWLPNGLSDAEIEEDVLSDDYGRQLSAQSSLEALGTDLNLETESDDSTYLDDIKRQLDRSLDDTAHLETSRVDGDVESNAEILIAEDNPDMRRLLKTLIGRRYRVRTARNGREALEVVNHHRPDLILSDVMMPEMDGTELCRRIKENPETQEIPVVLVTSKAESEMKVEGLELGADDYVTKPFHPRELLARVGSLVRSSVLRRELAVRNEQLGEALEELKRTQVLLVQNERLAAVGELAAGVAHEINNPVNFALNAARMLASNAAEIQAIVSEVSTGSGNSKPGSRSRAAQPTVEELGEDVSELSGIVIEGLERTQTLVRDLTNFASPSKRDERARSRTNLAQCAQAAAKLIAPTLRSANVDVKFENPDLRLMVEFDEGAMGQVFLNLFKNACDAMAPVGGTVHVKFDTTDCDVNVRISDEGSGISAEAQDRVFEPFFTTKDAGEGTGLGLAVSRQIVVDHAGSIKIESEPGHGTTVHVRLPRAD